MKSGTKLTEALENGIMEMAPSPDDDARYDKGTAAIIKACEEVESFIMAIDPVNLEAEMVANDTPTAPAPTGEKKNDRKKRTSEEHSHGLVAKTALALEDILVRSIRDICEKALGEDGSALVMSTPKGGPNAMADLSTAVGFEENVAYMFFSSKEEEGMAHAMGLQTVAIWYDTTSEQLFTMGATETGKDLTSTLDAALPDRSEISAKSNKTQTLVMGSQFGLRRGSSPVHGSPELHESLENGRAMIQNDGANLNASLALETLRRQKRRLAEDEQELADMAPAAAFA